MEQITGQVTEQITDDQVLELGMVMGQRRAFGMVSGRCSAAQAECLRTIHEEKAYLKFAPSWEAFCEKRLKISRRNADRTIALLKKHGSLFFEAAALTGISPAEFERIGDAIREDGIHVAGEVIALIPENAARAMEAIAQLQSDAAANNSAPEMADRIAELEKRGEQLYAAFRKVAQSTGGAERQRLIGAIGNMRRLIERLEWNFGTSGPRNRG